MASTLMSAPTVSMTATAPAKTSLLGMTRQFDVSRSHSSLSFSPRKRSVGGTNKISCMLVWPNKNLKKFETLSYLPDLTPEKLTKEIQYLLRNRWVPCIEFDEYGTITRKYHASPGYYDGRYWTMWKLPMFGCNDSALVIREIEECKKAYPEAFVRIIGFDNVRQVQCIGFIVHKPPQKMT